MSRMDAPVPLMLGWNPEGNRGGIAPGLFGVLFEWSFIDAEYPLFIPLPGVEVQWMEFKQLPVFREAQLGAAGTLAAANDRCGGENHQAETTRWVEPHIELRRAWETADSLIRT